MAPGTLAYAWLGYAGREALADNRSAINYALIALALLAAVALLPRLIRRMRGDRELKWIEVELLASWLKDGANVAAAKQFVRFLVAEGWLMHYLNFSGERLLPSIPALLDQPFWLDVTDRHRMAAAMQAASRPVSYNYAAVSGNPGHDLAAQQGVWMEGVQRVITDGISPEQAVNGAIARIKQILDK